MTGILSPVIRTIENVPEFSHLVDGSPGHRGSHSGLESSTQYTDAMPPPLLESISLAPLPAVDAYKGGIDRTLLLENLKLTPAERVDKMLAALRFAEAVRASRAQSVR